MSRCSVLVALASVAGWVSVAQAAPVYVFGTGDAALDQAYAAALAAEGHAPTIGAQWNAFDGSVNLSGFRVVLMTHGRNWLGAGEVPVAGQQQLVQFVNGGGGLITTEWLLYNNGTSGGVSYGVLGPVLPAAYGGSWNAVSQTTFTQETPDAVVNAGLPASFELTLDVLAGGTESRLNAKAGATTFYTSSNLGGVGAAGWGVGAGRAVSLSLLPGLNLLGPGAGRTLLGNLVDWAAQGAPPSCRADLNSDGELTFDDIAIFVGLYNASDPRADFNGDGEWTFDDIPLFVSAYNAGC
jgi:hypothetical protein